MVKQQMPLVPEMTSAGGHQSDAVLVAAVNSILVTHAATWVSNGLHTGFARQLNRVVPGKGKEGVTCHDRALHTHAQLSVTTPAIIDTAHFLEKLRCRRRGEPLHSPF